MWLVKGPTDNRGVSEIYGTILIFALVFVTAVALVGVGLFVVNDTTSNANDRLAQDSVLELDDRLAQLTEEGVESTITWEVPQGTAQDFRANGSQGSINVTARTTDRYWNASSGAPGGLVNASTQLNSQEVKLGTITHKSQDGVLTVYQGGGVLEVQDGSVTVLREPDVSVTDGNLVLDFVNISSVENVDGSELEATQRGSRADTEAIQRLVDRTMKRDGDVIAPAEINLTVTSRFADGWGKLVKESVDSRPVTVWDSDDLSGLGKNQVRIGFGTFGEGIDLPSKSNPYDSGVIYTGIADLAPELYDDTEGTIDEAGDGFEVTEVVGRPNSSYTVGLRYDAGNGSNWWEWNPSGNQWVNIEDPTAANLSEAAPDAVDDVDGDKFQIADDAWTVVAEGNSLRGYVDKAGEGAFVEPVGIESPDESVAEFRSLLEIESFDVDGPSDRKLEFGNESVRVNVTVKNTGTAPADDGEPVGVVIETLAGDQWVGEGGRLGDDLPSIARDGGKRDFSFTYTPNFLGQKFTVGAGTPDDNRSDGTTWEVVKTPDAQDFEVLKPIGTNDPVVAGDTLELDVRVYNNGSSADTQDVVVSSPAGPQVIKEYDPDPGDSEVQTIEWQTEVGDGDTSNIPLNISTLTDTVSKDVEIRPAGSTFADFAIEDVDIDKSVEEGNDLEAEVDINNTGGDDGTRTIRLRDQNGVIRATVEDVTLNSGQTVTLGGGEPPLVWNTELGDAGVYDLTVETDDDTNTTTGVQVTAPPGAGTFNVSIDDAAVNNVSAGDGLEVPFEVEYDGGGTRTESLWLEDFDGKPVNATTVTLSSGNTKQRTLTWETESGDGEDNPETVTVNGVGDTDNTSVEVKPEDEAGPSYTIASVSTNSSTSPSGALPPDPTVEGEDLEIDLILENTGSVVGTETVVVEYVPEDRPIATKEVTVPTSGPKNVDLTWETVIGDNTTTEGNPNNAEDIEVEIAGNNKTEEVFIDNRTTGRAPVDVMFAIDETGSMGQIIPDFGSGNEMVPTATEQISDYSFFGEDFAVPSDVSFGSSLPAGGQEFWYVNDDVDYPFTDGTIYDSGETVQVGGIESNEKDVWGGKKYTTPQTVPEDADLWYVLPITSGSLDGAARFHYYLNPDGSYYAEPPEGTYYASGQTVDPADHSGEAYVFELDGSSCGCNDPTGERYAAVQTALDSLDESVGDRAGLMEFNSSQNVYQDISGDIGAVKNAMRINPGGYTDVSNALLEAESELNNVSNPNKKNIVLLTDGKHDPRDELSVDDPDEVAEDIDENVTVYVVGFGNADTSPDSDLYNVSEAGTGDGKLYDGDNDDLEDIFGEIGDELDSADRPSVQVSTDPSYSVTEGNTLTIDVGVENTGEDGEQIITLTDIYGNIVDSATVDLDANESIAASNSSAPELEWTANLQGGDDPPKEGELLIRTPNSEARPDVNVTAGPPSNFDVSIQNVSPSDPQATKEIDVEAKIENTQAGSDNQTVVMRDDDGNPVDVKTIRLEGNGNPNDDVTKTFRWQTQSSDAGNGQTVTIESEDDTATQSIDIADPPGTDDEFDIDIVGINDPVTAGDNLEVEIQVENVGNDTGKRFVELYDFANRTVDLTETSELGSNGTETFNLTWNTEAGDGATDDIYVLTRDDEVGQTVDVQSVTGPDTDFQITNPRPLTDPIEAGDDLNVAMDIENTGSDEGAQFVEAEFNGLTKAKNVTVGSGSTKNVTFEYGTSESIVNSQREFTIDLETNDDNASTNVTIDPESGTPLDVTIVDTSPANGTVTAGEKLGVDVEVTGLSSASVLSLETPYGGPLQPADVESITSDGRYTLTWSTLVGQGDPDKQQISARVESETDTTQVTVEEAPESDVAAPGTGPDSDPVGIDIEEIEMN